MDTGEDVSHKKGPGVKKAKKLSTRVDMTPMVDLGFLLITFFIYTTTMSLPKALDLRVPKDTDKPKEQNEAKESGALTIMLGKKNQVYYYMGQLKVDATENNFKQTTFKEIRNIIIDKKKDVINRHVHSTLCEDKRNNAKKDGDPNWEKACEDMDFVVIIKPNADATYKNMVDILDEMTINRVKTYAIVKILEDEVALIKKTEEANGIK
jgi:biopolymer transport protein ExbD